jgi:glycosyltransferase involved in cell wall biosynthesis
MRIVDVTLVYDENLETEEAQLKQHYTSVGWAESLSRQGAEVFSIKRFSKESSIVKNGVQYYFIKDRFGPKMTNKQFPLTVFKKIVSLEPDVVHLHGLSHSIQTFFLRLWLKKKTAIIIQHHGGPFPRKGVKKKIHDLLNSVADGFFFTTLEQGKQWFTSKKFQNKIMPILEGAPVFNVETMDADRNPFYQSREEARSKTNIHGNPVFLWVGRLDENKDPLTVLAGFEILCRWYPVARLHMIYTDEKLLREVKHVISSSDVLKGRVQLLGRIKLNEREFYYNSADYFVLGSHYEGTCYSLSDALSCGCIPVITNIPSFKLMTDNGRLGSLWEPGNVNSFVESAKLAMSKPRRNEVERCIDFFKTNISFEAIARIAIKHYRVTIEKRQYKSKS